MELNNERSRWRKKKNGLPQGSILAPTLFNINTNDQLIHDGTRSFIYAADLCITAKYQSFKQVEETTEEALDNLTIYYKINSLRAYPKYLGVTLDRSLCYKQHIQNTKMKVASRNNLLRKLVTSKWGANPGTIRMTTLELSYSTAEYASPAWA